MLIQYLFQASSLYILERKSWDIYNINLLNYSGHSLTSDFVDLMHSYSFISLINRPTRITENSAPLIDNIFVNKPNLSSFQAILVTDISDHLPLIYI